MGYPRSAAAGVRSRSGAGRRIWAPLEMPPVHPEPAFEPEGTSGIWDEAFAGFRRVEPDERYPDASQTTIRSERGKAADRGAGVGAAIAARDTTRALALWETSRTVPETATYAAAVHLLVARDVVAAMSGRCGARTTMGSWRPWPRRNARGWHAGRGEDGRRGARQRIAARIALREAISRRDFYGLAGLACSGELDCLAMEPAQVRAVDGHAVGAGDALW